jgi:hypothetical protein
VNEITYEEPMPWERRMADDEGCYRARYLANEISRQHFIALLVEHCDYDWFGADHEANCIDAREGRGDPDS